jgi:dihydrofolate reductase
VYSFEEAYREAEATGKDKCFIIGGAAVYREAMPRVKKLYLTKVLSQVQGDVFFPEWGEGWRMVSEEAFPADEKNDFPTAFQVWERD